MHHRFLRSIAAALLAASAPALAQQKSPPPNKTPAPQKTPTPKKTSAPKTEAPAAPTVPVAARTGRAAIVGIILDSLNGGFLSGADVIVQGVKANLVTDASGKFTLDSLDAGNYQVGVFHPLLDTLGISLASQPFHVGNDSVSYVILAVPSAQTLIRRSCPRPGPRAQGTSAVIGHVIDPESLQPVAGADVSIAWSQIEASKAYGVRRTPRVLRDSTDEHGRYRICGLPNSMQATLQARKGGAVTAEVPIALGDQETELFARTMLLSSVDSGAKTGKAMVSGRVLLEGAASNLGSRVEVVGTDKVVLTNEKGDFTISGLPSGSHVLMARHLGFGAETVPVDLSSREPKQVSVRLPKFVASLDPVLVTARRTAGLDKVGFNQRKKSGTGFYLGPDQIQAMHPNELTDILRVVPSLRVQYGPQGEVVTSSRGVTGMGGAGCVSYVVDDMPWQSAEPGDINQFINGREVVGVEVYAGPGAPPQYTQAGADCTTVVIWTKFKIRDQK